MRTGVLDRLNLERRYGIILADADDREVPFLDYDVANCVFSGLTPAMRVTFSLLSDANGITRAVNVRPVVPL